MKYSETLKSPVKEPVELLEAANHAKALPDDDEYALIEGYITAAREYCEGITGRSLVDRSMTAYPESASNMICLPKPPVAAVESITFYDVDGNSHVVTDYMLNNDKGELFINDVPSVAFRDNNPIEIKYTAGYNKIPGLMRQAMLLLIGHWYMNREAVVVGPNASVEVGITTRTLLRQFKAWWM